MTGNENAELPNPAKDNGGGMMDFMNDSNDPVSPAQGAMNDMSGPIKVVGMMFADRTVPSFDIDNAPEDFHVWCALITKYARGMVLNVVLEEDLPDTTTRFELPGNDPKKEDCQLGDFVLVVNPERPDQFDIQYIKRFGSIIVERKWKFPLHSGTRVMIIRPETSLGYTPLCSSVEAKRYRMIAGPEDPVTRKREMIDAYEIRYQGVVRVSCFNSRLQKNVQ